MKDALRTITNRMFRTDDAFARSHGWEIRLTRSGLGRVYRDRRFRLLARCAACRGTGTNGDLACVPCAGVGRITLAAEPSQAAPGDERQPAHVPE